MNQIGNAPPHQLQQLTSMGDAIFVQVVETLEQLKSCKPHFVLGQSTVLLKVREEIASCCELKDEACGWEACFFPFDGVEKTNDIRMSQTLEDLSLGAHLDSLLLLGLNADSLDCSLQESLAVGGEVHHAKSAVPQAEIMNLPGFEQCGVAGVGRPEQ